MGNKFRISKKFSKKCKKKLYKKCKKKFSKKCKKKSIRSVRRTIRSANRNSIRSARRNSVRSEGSKSNRNRRINDYDPLSNTHLFMRKAFRFNEFCLLIDKNSFYGISIQRLFNSLINQNYELPLMKMFIREYENLISQFLDFGKIQVLTETKTNNSINNLKNISIFGSPNTTSNPEFIIQIRK